MSGMLYKELRINMPYILILIFIPALLTFMPVLAGSGGESFSLVDGISQTSESGALIRMFFFIIGYLVAGTFQTITLAADEKRLWKYFAASTPECARGAVYHKYLLVFMMCGIFMMSCYFSDMIFCSVAMDVVGTEVMPLTGGFIILFYLQLLLRAVELPFLFRFGTQRGSHVKSVMFAVVILAAALYLLFGPLPENFDELISALYGFIERLAVGDLPDGLMLAQGLFPFFSVGAYILSYKLSCGFYLKGAESE